MKFLFSLGFIFLGACCFAMAAEEFIKKRYWWCGFYIMEMLWMIIFLAKIIMSI